MRWGRAARQAWIAHEYHELPPLDGVDGVAQKRVVPYGEARALTHRHMPEGSEFFRALTCWSGEFCSEGHVKLTSPQVCINAGPSGPDFMNDSIVTIIYYMVTVLGWTRKSANVVHTPDGPRDMCILKPVALRLYYAVLKDLAMVFSMLCFP